MALKLLAELDSYQIKFWAPNTSKLDDFCNCPNIRQKDIEQIHSAMSYLLTNWKLPTNKKRFRDEDDGIYAMKAGALRLYGFFEKSVFIVVHCIRKQRGKLTRQDKKTCLKRMKTCKDELA